jgi:hypothetical protein
VNPAENPYLLGVNSCCQELAFAWTASPWKNGRRIFKNQKALAMPISGCYNICSTAD